MTHSNLMIKHTILNEEIEASPEWWREHFPDEAEDIIASALTLKEDLETLSKVRALIKRQVGDAESLLGTTADVTQINAAAILAFIVALEANTSFTDFRSQFMSTIEGLLTPAAPGAEDVYTQAANFLVAVETGQFVLTASLKGLSTVLAEMGERSTGVASVLAQTQTQLT